MTQDQQLHIDSEILEATIEETAGPGRGHIVDVTLIRAGTSSNGNHYPEQVLQDATVLFEGARAFADHKGPTDRAERSVRDLVGYYRQPRYELTPEGGRIRATFHLLPGNDWLWGIIQEATIEPGICGLSIDALGETKQSEVQGRSVRMVESVRKVKSVDIVTRPAAGGSLDRIVAGETGEVGDGEGDPGLESGGAHLAGAVHESKGREADRGPRSDDASDVSSTADSDVFNADERKQYASVTRHHEGGSTEYKFPIPPRGTPGAEEHARNALARLDQSDLTDEEKEAVRAKAHAVLESTAEPTNGLARLDQSDLTDGEKEAVHTKEHAVLDSAAKSTEAHAESSVESTEEDAVTETQEVETPEATTQPSAASKEKAPGTQRRPPRPGRPRP